MGEIEHLDYDLPIGIKLPLIERKWVLAQLLNLYLRQGWQLVEQSGPKWALVERDIPVEKG